MTTGVINTGYDSVSDTVTLGGITPYGNAILQVSKSSSDVLVDGVSLKDFMRDVNARLGILVPNPKVENEWEELKALGDQYRKLEKEFIEKSKMWNILKDDHLTK